MTSEQRYAFIAEFHDTQADLLKQFHLLYFLSDKTLELIDSKSGRKFLKRCEYPQIKPSDLFIGSVVTVYARQLKLVDYADQFTASVFGAQQERTLAMIKPDAYKHMGKIIKAITAELPGIRIAQLKMAKMSPQDAEDFYAVHRGKPFFNDLIAFMSSDVVVAMELVGADAIKKWRGLIGPTGTDAARKEAPRSLRAQFGTNNTQNACHGSDSPQSAATEISFFFGAAPASGSASPAASSAARSGLNVSGAGFNTSGAAGHTAAPGSAQRISSMNPALLDHCSCMVIKPHVVAAGLAGDIIDAVLQEGLEISALQSFVLDKPQTQEFLEVYRGVVPEFTGIVEELSNGQCLALEVRGENVVSHLRELAGPHDTEIAKELRPDSLRARFGVDKIRNAVHVTDLTEDGELEVQYFFRILQH